MVHLVQLNENRCLEQTQKGWPNHSSIQTSIKCIPHFGSRVTAKAFWVLHSEQFYLFHFCNDLTVTKVINYEFQAKFWSLLDLILDAVIQLRNVWGVFLLFLYQTWLVFNICIHSEINSDWLASNKPVPKSTISKRNQNALK